VVCRFTRIIEVNEDEKVFGLNADYHLMIAHGPAFNGKIQLKTQEYRCDEFIVVFYVWI
jgi:hypothetical protein